MKETIYWAAPLFTLAERAFNLNCAKILRNEDYMVILPQEQAEPFDMPRQALELAEQCKRQVIQSDVLVAILDGPDTDSGTSMEIGIKIASRMLTGKGLTIGIRTDFRASEDGQLNAMFRLMDKVVYLPSYTTDPFDKTKVVKAITEAIHELQNRELRRHIGR